MFLEPNSLKAAKHPHPLEWPWWKVMSVDSSQSCVHVVSCTWEPENHTMKICPIPQRTITLTPTKSQVLVDATTLVCKTCSFSAFPGTCNFSPQTAIIPKIFPISFKCTEHRNDPLTQRHYPRSSHTSIHPSNVITCNITWIWKNWLSYVFMLMIIPQSSLSLSSYLSSFFFAPFPIQPTIIICNNIVDLPEVKGSHRKFRTIVSSLIGTCNMVYGVCSLIKKVYKLIQLWGPPSLKRWPRASLEGLLLWWWWWKVAARVRPSLPVSAWIRFRLSLGHLLSLFF